MNRILTTIAARFALLSALFVGAASAQVRVAINENSPELMLDQAPCRLVEWRDRTVCAVVRDGQVFAEGDMLLGTEAEVLGPNAMQPKASLINGDRYRWPENVVPYDIDASGNPAQAARLRDTVAQAIRHWEERTPFRFVLRTGSHRDYVVFTSKSGSDGGCYSYVGRIGGAQPINLEMPSPGDPSYCGVGPAIHEIGHAIGLFHEQSRNDRDRYVQIRTDNIPQDYWSQFRKETRAASDIGAYDFASIMHYEQTAFAINRSRPTIVTVPQGIPIGQRAGLSAGDIDVALRLAGAARPYVVASNPAGLPLIVDGNTCTSPCVFDRWEPGSEHTIEAPEEAIFDGSAAWRFARWSHDGARIQTIRAEGGDRIFLANYSDRLPAPSQIDLVIDQFLAPTAGVAGGWLEDVAVTVRNAGATSAERFRLGFYLSDDPNISVTDYFIEYRCWFNNGLPAGASGVCSGRIRLPENLRARQLYLGVVIDDLLDIDEVDELNNSRPNDAGPLTIQFADLRLVSLTAPRLMAAGGDRQEISAVIRNDGEIAARPFRVDFLLSPTASLSASSAINMAWFCDVNIVLAPGQQTTCRGAYGALSNFSAGVYYVLGLADVRNVNSDLDLENNWLAATTGATRITHPDLTVTRFTASNSTPHGGRVTVNATVTNQGEVPWPGAAIVRFYLSASESVRTTDRALGLCTLVNLEPGESKACMAEFALSSDVRPGRYFVGMIVDPDNLRRETNEENNSRMSDAGPLQILAPDLEVVSVQAPAVLSTATLAEVTATVRNRGEVRAGSFTLRFVLSTDTTLTVEDYRIAGCGFPEGLAAGASATCRGTVMIQSNVPAGTYHLGAIADEFNFLVEMDKTNNSKSNDAGQVMVALPDLTVSSVRVPTTVVFLQRYEIPIQVTNVGLAESPSADVELVMFDNPQLLGAGTRMGSCTTLNRMAAGQSSTCTAVFSTNSISMAGRTVYFGARVNQRGTIREANHQNNLRANDLGPTVLIRR